MYVVGKILDWQVVTMRRVVQIRANQEKLPKFFFLIVCMLHQSRFAIMTQRMVSKRKLPLHCFDFDFQLDHR